MIKWIKTPKRKLSIPDWLSLYRILSAPVLVALIFLDMRLPFAILLLASFLSDALDGFLARRMNVVTQRGAQLDSIGDAVTFTVGLVGMVKFETDFVSEQLALLLFAFGFYILQLGLAYWRYGMPSSFHTYLAKLSAVFQGVFMLWLFFVGIEYWLFYTVVALSILETIEEIWLIILFPKWRANVKGLLWVLNKKENEKNSMSG
ncbi:MAG: CDP-alcohol phosphatidyltransferase family protein [Cyclobacteriaceae bacterium]